MYRQSRIAKRRNKSNPGTDLPTSRASKSGQSWESVHRWYDKSVGDKGLYYHEHVILPSVLELLHLTPHAQLLDCGCGQGILERMMPKDTRYFGFDISQSLIKNAKGRIKNPSSEFFVHNAHESLPGFVPDDITHITFILSLQNMSNGALAIKQAVSKLTTKGKIILVLNHPAFRIPRQSGWDVDPKSKQQFRWINRYMSPMKIPILMHPGLGEQSATTVSFHNPISTYIDWLAQEGCFVTKFQEWTSDKQSVGKQSKMENRSREEIPLFLALVAEKQ